MTHELTLNRAKQLVFHDASCDFVDRPLPSKQKELQNDPLPSLTVGL